MGMRRPYRRWSEGDPSRPVVVATQRQDGRRYFWRLELACGHIEERAVRWITDSGRRCSAGPPKHARCLYCPKERCVLRQSGVVPKVPAQKIQLLACALRHVADKHGRPTTIRTATIMREHVDVEWHPKLTQTDVSRIGRSTMAMIALHRVLGGRSGWGAPPAFARGRWAL